MIGVAAQQTIPDAEVLRSELGDPPMNLCSACGKDCETTDLADLKPDDGHHHNDWFRVNCKTYCTFEIHRVAIKRAQESEHEKRRLLAHLKNASNEKTMPKISYDFGDPKAILKFLAL